jgi:glycogen synthase
LTSALLAVVEALRLNPDRYAIIYNTKYDNNDSGSSTAVVEVPYSSSSSSPTYPKPYQNHYYNEYHEGILEIAKTFFNGLLNQIVNKTTVAAVKKKTENEVIIFVFQS